LEFLLKRYENPYAIENYTWCKGNLHAHSTESDGSISPQKLCEAYRMAGYDFVAITDHNMITDTSAYSRPDFLTIPGVEVGRTEPPPKDLDLARDDHFDHVLHIGAQSCVAFSDLKTVLHDLQRECGLAIIAHPHSSLMSWDRITAAGGFTGIEIWNYSAGNSGGRGYSVELWDMLLNSGYRVWGFAGDDCHFREKRPNFCGGWIQVAAKTLDQADILEAIKRGAFYSSQGPSFFEIATTEKGLYVHCSPVKVIRICTRLSAYSWCVHARVGEDLRYLTLPWDELCLKDYFRLEIVDVAGRIAWSNPIYLSTVKDGLDPCG
jgi:hypothetical protein